MTQYDWLKLLKDALDRAHQDIELVIMDAPLITHASVAHAYNLANDLMRSMDNVEILVTSIEEPAAAPRDSKSGQGDS